MGLERRFFDEMLRVLRGGDLAVQSMIVGDADHADKTSGYPHLAAHAKLDFIDGHGYWHHPEIGGPLTKTKNTPMVNDPLDSTVVQFARTPMAGKAFTVSETNQPFPHRYACENFAILTAYAMFQGWDGIYWFDWGGGRTLKPAAGVPPGRGSRSATTRSSWPTSPRARSCGTGRTCDRRRRPSSAPTRRTRSSNRSAWTASSTRRSSRRDSRARRHCSTARGSRWTPRPRARPSRPPRRSADRERHGRARWLNADKARGVVEIDAARTQAVVGSCRTAARPRSTWRPAGCGTRSPPSC
jgi:hypothetical protein